MTVTSNKVDIYHTSGMNSEGTGFMLHYSVRTERVSETTTDVLDSGCFLCDDSSQCISMSQLCDSHNDCLDMTDEENCQPTDSPSPARSATPTASHPRRNSSAENKTSGLCDEGEFDCDGNGTLCINPYKICDTVWDCPNGNDEDSNCVDKTYTRAVVFRDGWYDDYLHISSDKSLFDDFRRNYYQDNRFERVKGERPPDWPGFMTFSSTPDFSDLEDVLKLSKDEVHKYGHQLEDFVLQCTYDEKPCNISQDFYTFQDHLYGNCFKFNHGRDGLPVFHATRTGSSYGLKLTLFLEQSEYISIYGRNAGARVNIVPYDVPSFPFNEGITIKPGTVTSLAIKEHVITRLSDPYGECEGDQHTKQGENTYYGSSYRYKLQACQDYCLRNKIALECGCSQKFRMEGIPPCSILNKTQDLCQQLMHFLFQKNMLDCGCPVPCWDKYYTYTASQSAWPAEVYLKPLLRSLQSTNDKTRNINDMETANMNLASLVIYFDALNYELISENPDYPVESLFSDIGGTLGLYIGLSIITVLEFFEFMYDIATFLATRVYSPQ
ncbi:acid-sensing ion channel 2-like [Ptychodera flava]|uniref:acid-sensing ion channel 2-like n=1 Tax=Ptychodera flava TaxID=63121 RepID=UPI003969F5F4